MHLKCLICTLSKARMLLCALPINKAKLKNSGIVYLKETFVFKVIILLLHILMIWLMCYLIVYYLEQVLAKLLRLALNL